MPMIENDCTALSLIVERFGRDALISLAALGGPRPAVRIVNSYYENGAFYAVTYALSGKGKQIEKNPQATVCGEWFLAHGMGGNIGHPQDEKNAGIIAKFCGAFDAWYENGHTDESDSNACILRIRLTDGMLFHHGAKYEIAFEGAR